MESDELGVVGFFEDLPILLFVLAGTFIMVVSSISVSETLISAERSDELDLIADRCVDLLLYELIGHGRGASVLIGSVCSTSLCRAVEEFLEGKSFSTSIVMVHPELRWLLRNDHNGSRVPERASSASRLLNAVTDDGLSAILVVRVIVWQ